MEEGTGFKLATLVNTILTETDCRKDQADELAGIIVLWMHTYNIW